MSIRVSIVSTRTGDDGTTGLGDRSRVPKDALRIQALGDVDELNSLVGLLRTEPLPDTADTLLEQIQQTLFDLGGELCIPGSAAIDASHVAALDAAVTRLNTGLGQLKEFVLPGGTRAAALAHLARTVARRAERTVVALGRTETVNAPVRHYLNRLSDVFFVLARALNHEAGAPDVLWKGPSERP